MYTYTIVGHIFDPMAGNRGNIPKAQHEMCHKERIDCVREK